MKVDERHLKHYTDWGLTHYDKAFTDQLHYVQNHINRTIEDTLIFTEHYPVYTVGTRKDSHSNILWDNPTLQTHGISLAKTNRGGDVTYHGPGQIVGYPIISLAKSRDIHAYLRNLEQVLINAIGCHGLATSRRPGKTGIWVKDKKIAAIGVAVKKWVTYHGFALNINNDLSPFQGIIPCGISPQEGGITSMEHELRMKLDLEEIKHTIASEFWKIFKKE